MIFTVTYLNTRFSTKPTSLSSILTTFPRLLTLQTTIFPYHSFRTSPDSIRIHLLLGWNGARWGVKYATNIAGVAAKGPLEKLHRLCIGGGFMSWSSISVFDVNNQREMSSSSGVTVDGPLPWAGTGTMNVPEHLPSNRRAFGVALYFCGAAASETY